MEYGRNTNLCNVICLGDRVEVDTAGRATAVVVGFGTTFDNQAGAGYDVVLLRPERGEVYLRGGEPVSSGYFCASPMSLRRIGKEEKR